jgi:arylsulfatase A-like enzyme
VRDERYRYIRYVDGSEELYDHRTDPHEWTNLAESPEHARTKAALAQFMPRADSPPIGGAGSD